MGAPSKLTPATIKRGTMYYKKALDTPGSVPTLQGLSRAMGVSLTTTTTWRDKAENAAYLELILNIELLQHDRVLEGSLLGTYNPAIAKLILSRHGYGDRHEVDHTSSDKSMTPKTVITLGGRSLGMKGGSISVGDLPEDDE